MSFRNNQDPSPPAPQSNLILNDGYFRPARAVAIFLAGASNAAKDNCRIEARQKIDIRAPLHAAIESAQV
jgi:hypothetical protein